MSKPLSEIKLKLYQKIVNDQLIVTCESLDEIFYVVSTYSNRFYVSSSRGLDTAAANVYFPSIESAMKYLKNTIKTILLDKSFE